MPLTTTPLDLPLKESITVDSTRGITSTTSSKPNNIFSIFFALKFSEFSFIYSVACPFKPIILVKSSSLKPFITDITMINVATPRAIPIKENQLTIEIKPSSLLALKYL